MWLGGKLLPPLKYRLIPPPPSGQTAYNYNRRTGIQCPSNKSSVHNLERSIRIVINLYWLTGSSFRVMKISIEMRMFQMAVPRCPKTMWPCWICYYLLPDYQTSNLQWVGALILSVMQVSVLLLVYFSSIDWLIDSKTQRIVTHSPKMYESWKSKFPEFLPDAKKINN